MRKWALILCTIILVYSTHLKAEPTFCNTTNGWCQDKEGLSWAFDIGPATFTQKEAAEYCERQAQTLHSKIRLPDYKELRRYGHFIIETGSNYIPVADARASIWTRTPLRGSADDYYFLNGGHGYIFYFAINSTKLFARCVKEP